MEGLGFHGSDIKRPNLDRLAQEGEAFGAVKPALFGSVALPGDEQGLETQP